MADEVTSGYAPADGVDVYWESRGSGGTPLLMVHGGYGTTAMFGPVPELLARDRQVVSIELEGHGHTRNTSRPFTWERLGEQVAGVVRHLGFGQADLLGWSLGGGAVLRCAIQHQDLVRKLVVVSAPCRRAAWFPEVLAGFDSMTAATLAPMLRQSPLGTAYAEVAPDPDAFPSLVDKSGELLRRPYDWSDEVKGLTIPVLIAYADADSIPPSHAAEFFALLGGGLRDANWDGSLAPASRLAILPGMTHYNIGPSPKLAAAVADFLGLSWRQRGAAMSNWFQQSVVDPGRLRLFCFFVSFIAAFAFIRFSVRMIRAQVKWWPGNVTPGGVHVHHAVFGLVFMCVGGVGGLAVQDSDSGWAAIAAALLGIGMALLLDEFALVLFLRDVYWSEQGRLSVEVVFVAIALCGLALLGWVPAGFAPGPGGRVAAYLGIILALTVNLLFMVVCLLKGKTWCGVLGVYIGLIALIGAIRLARPGSLWARWRYPLGSRKMARATARELRYAQPVHRFRIWFQDLVAGRPDHGA